MDLSVPQVLMLHTLGRYAGFILLQNGTFFYSWRDKNHGSGHLERGVYMLHTRCGLLLKVTGPGPGFDEERGCDLTLVISSQLEIVAKFRV